MKLLFIIIIWHFFSFYKCFFYTQQVFVFPLLREENITKDITNLFILKKDIKKLRQEKETKAIKDRIL